MLTRLNRLTLTFFCSLILAGCGSGVLMASGTAAAASTPGTPATTTTGTSSQVSVSVSGASLVTLGTPVQYSASILNTSNTAVTWKIVGTSTSENYGTISATGLYTPPATVPVHTQIQIVATSEADATKSSTTLATISNPVPSISSATFTAGYHSSFLVDVHGSNFMPTSALTYGGYGVTTTYVSSTEMKFTLASAPTAGTVVALGVITPAPGRTQSANFSATVPAAVAVTVSGGSIAAAGSAAMQFNSTVTGTTNAAVTWSIVGTSTSENYGKISSIGLYTPPATVPVHTGISIVATSTVDTTKDASTSVTIQQPTATITSATLTPAAGGNFLVDVKGTNFLSSSSAMPGSYGVATTYVSPTELKFTLTSPPSAGSKVQLAVVNPAPGKTVSATYAMTIPGSVGVTVTGPAIAAIGTPLQYTAAVTGTSTTSVTWSIKGTSTSENYGTISSTGLYTPPTTVPVHTGISIIATSTVDTTKSYAEAVTIQQPTPVITGTALTPNTTGGYLVDVLGSNFVATSGVVPGTYGMPTTFISATHLQFTLNNPPSSGGTVPLWVINPAPGRTQSATYNMVISTAVSVSLKGSATAYVGSPVQYTAGVSGTSNTGLTWAIKGTSTSENYGTISAAGLYTPPAAVPVHTGITITATSKADTTKSATVAVTISNPIPAITSATLTAGYHSTFLVDAYGTGFMPISGLTYAGYGVATTYVSATHMQFTLSNPPAAGTVEVLGVVNPAPGRTQSANFNITVPAVVAVKVSGAAVATVGTPTQYLAAVTGTTNAGVTWTITGASTTENYGAISSSGLYEPPAVVPAHNAITIIGTSTVDSTKWSSTPVTIMNTVPVITSGTSAASGKGQVSFDVKGYNFISTSTVMFSGYGLATTYVSPTELTAVMPQTTVAAQTAGAPISISVATPNPGKTQSDSFNVTLPGQVGVVVTGSNMVATGTPSQYMAAVTGSTNTAVTWSVKAASGVNAGTISSTGLYTPPASITANTPVTIVATSQAQTTSTGTVAVTLVSVPVAAAARLIDQSSFGPTHNLIQHVQTIGLENYVNEQLALPATVMPLTDTFTQSCGSNPAACLDMDYWNDIVTAPDQLRQRVAMALQEMLVVSYEDANPIMVASYSNMLTQDAFANWSKIMKDMTLSPAMGMFLNMANSSKPPAGQIANENFARENMQLFNIGLNMLNQDGTEQTDSNGNPIPAYTEAQVEAYSRVFTGWTYAPASGAQIFPNYNTFNPYLPMAATESAHDTTSKILLNTTLPAGQTAEQDLAGAIQDVFNHPNVGPFVTQQLITHLVKSNPSPAYVSRMSAVFANDGTGVRGNMAAVIKAILLDPEARAGDTTTVANDGYLREPILYTADVLRGLNAVPKPTVVDNSAYSVMDSIASAQQEPVFYSPTVFNYYPTTYNLAGSGMNAPQFALETSATIMTKLSVASSAVNNLLGKLGVDLSATSTLGTLAASSNDLLLDELSNVFMHGTMSSQMRSTIETALSGITDPAQRVRVATYLVLTSSQYKVIH